MGHTYKVTGPKSFTEDKGRLDIVTDFPSGICPRCNHPIDDHGKSGCLQCTRLHGPCR